ncbi:hypothetical protein ACTMU2_40505 [Cupriavidus basilensis]
MRRVFLRDRLRHCGEPQPDPPAGRERHYLRLDPRQLYQEVTFQDGVVQQKNFHDFPVVRSWPIAPRSKPTSLRVPGRLKALAKCARRRSRRRWPMPCTR